MESINKHKDVLELVKEIYHDWEWGKDKVFIDSIKTKSAEDFAIGLHHTTGMKIRNSYGFWKKDTELYKHLLSLGISHPDEMSHKIFTELHRYATEQMAISL